MCCYDRRNLLYNLYYVKLCLLCPITVVKTAFFCFLCLGTTISIFLSNRFLNYTSAIFFCKILTICLLIITGKRYFCKMQEKLDQIKELESSLTGDMFHDADIRYRIHSIEMEIKNIDICEIDNDDCFCCGS